MADIVSFHHRFSAARRAILLCMAVALIAPGLHAETYNFQVLLDADASTTGCTVTLPSGALYGGVDARLTTSVAVDDVTGAGHVASVVAAACHNGAFSTPIGVDAGQWSAAGPYLVVETYFTDVRLLQLLGAGFPLAPRRRLAFVVTPAAGSGGDAISADKAGAILFPPPARKAHAVGSGPPRLIHLDGKTQDWGAIEAYPPDDSAYRGAIKLAGAYATEVGGTTYFRFDAAVNGAFFRATPEAVPAAGPVPLTVSFLTKSESTGTQIIRYRWDFDGDGIFDTDEPGAQNFTRTFTTPGVRNAVLEVTNEKNQVATATVTITVTGEPPRATASVNPSNGPAPLTVTLAGSAIPGTVSIARYEWDFEGDGFFDYSSPSSGITTHRYPLPGTYNAVFRVTDTDGLRATARASATAIRSGPPGSPTVSITSPSGPVEYFAPATISFSGSATTPAGTITKYEWDFNGDGVYDASSTLPSATSTFRSPGTFTVALRATNSSGLSSVDTVDVTIDIDAQLRVSADTIRTPGSITVDTTISGTAPVRIFIKNREGQTVRTLVNNVTRAAGSYSDRWDGTDALGKAVPEGEYFAVLEYQANGQPVVLDLSNTTGGTLYNPNLLLSTTKGGSCSECPFAPYENNYLQADLTLDRASEVTVSIRGFDSVNEVARLFDRRPFGAGKTYTVVWEGTDARGRLVHPSLYGDPQFIFGLTALTLPDNAVFVESAPELSNVAVTPNYYDPLTTDFINPQKAVAKASFTLSKQATVRLQVYDVGTNVLLRTIDLPNAHAGAGTMTWDGRDDHGTFADKGDYRLALKAIDAAGNQSMVRYALLKVFY